MSGQSCITSVAPGLTACIIRGSHFASCDGAEYRLTESGERSTGKPCPGCMPKEAKQGQLCWECWEAVRTAINESAAYMHIIGGVERLVQRDNGGVHGSTDGQIPLPVTALLLDELNSYLRSYHGNAEKWVASESGAIDAVKFSRTFKAAVKNHPVEEQPHGIKRTRCPDCEQVTLVWFPPAHENADVRVSCRNDECSYETDQDRFGALAGSTT